jgi:quinol monooxygenase YgiN
MERMVFDPTIVCSSRVRALPEEADRVRELLSGLVGPSLNEPSCLLYQVLRRLDDRSEFVVLEKWRSEGAYRRHREAAHVKEALEKAGPLLAEPPALEVFRLIR